jgi:adenosylhomocysteine nucleosidase
VKGPVAILCAIPQELEAVRATMDGMSVAPPGVAGTIDGRPVVLAPTGIGKVNAAVTATLVIERHRPSAIVVTGVAGGLDPDLRVGDVVVAGLAIQHDAGVLEDGGLATHQAGHVPFFNPSPHLGYRPPADLLERVMAALEGLQLEPVEDGGDRPRVVAGTVLTGDSFLASAGTRDALHRRFGAQAIEMEGAAVAQAARRLGVACLVVRALSDLAGAESDLDFGRFLPAVAANSAAVVRRLLPVL